MDFTVIFRVEAVSPARPRRQEGGPAESFLVSQTAAPDVAGGRPHIRFVRLRGNYESN